jgi:hypothetical protein
MPSLRSLHHWLLCAVLAVILLGGCVAMKPAKQTVSTATVLFTVVLSGEIVHQREAVGVIVSIDGQPNEPGWQVAFPANARVPGHYTSFLVRLELPAGAHKVSRLTAMVKGEASAAPIEIEPDLSFEVRANAADYLGRIEVSSPSKAVLTDAYQSDFPELARAWPALRKQKVGRRAPPGEVVLALEPSTARVPSAAAAEPPIRLDASAVAHLPKSARRAFESFLKSGYPRAFAVAASGESGRASGGNNVIGRALANCRRGQAETRQTEPRPADARQPEARKVRCRLFALDDTLLSSLQGSVPAPPTAVGKR